MLRGVSNRPVKIFCAYFGHIYIFYGVLLRFFHVRCLNILKFGNRYNFWDTKKCWCILTDLLFSCSILTIFDRPFYARAHDSKCLNDVYEAYKNNHILYKKFLVKSNWVKIRQILGGQYWPPPWT